MNTGLRDQVAMVSGPTQGIGLAIAERLAAEGVRLSLCSRNAAALEGLRRDLEARFGIETLAFPADLTEASGVSGWISATRGRFGRIDVLVNNASATRPAPAHEASPAVWDVALGLKLFGYANLAAGVFPIMKADGGGSIVNVIGTAAVQPNPTGGVRTVAATALAGLNKALSHEGAAHNIRVNAVCPGHTRTYRWQEWLDQVASNGGDPVQTEADVLADIPLGRIADPDDVAHAVVFLASSQLARHITGVMLNVDGGYVRGL